MLNLEKLEVTELQHLIENAHAELKSKQANKRKEILAQIKELADSIDIKVEIIDKSASSPVKAKVAAKYRHPQNKALSWTGRGIKPKWMKELLDQGKKLEDFLIHP
jgi:DNA-binding protein H-NS